MMGCLWAFYETRYDLILESVFEEHLRVIMNWYIQRENSTAGNRKEDVTASVAMVHSIPELIVSEQVKCYTE